MERPSEPLLRWLRARIDARGENTASVAKRLGRPRGEVRRMLTGSVPMTVDDLLTLSQALEVTPGDLGLSDEAVEAADVEEGVEAPDGAHWDNQPRRLLQVAFDHGIDVLVLADPAVLDGIWGGPDDVLSRFEGQELPIGLDAAYHRHMEPVFAEGAFEVTLSFDTLYRCTIPWHAIRRVVFTPLAPEPPEDAPADEDDSGSGVPHLRLV